MPFCSLFRVTIRGATGILLLGSGLALSACAGTDLFERPDIAPSASVVAQGFPSLLPRTAFILAIPNPPASSDLEARIALLRAKANALAGPVISAKDRARLAEAVKRTATR